MQLRVCDTYKAVRKLFSIRHWNLYSYDMFTRYILSPLYGEGNSVYYSSMNWEIFFSKIFLWLNLVLTEEAGESGRAGTEVQPVAV